MDRRHVELDLGIERVQVEARDAVDLAAEAGLEDELDPRRVAAERQLERLAAVDLDVQAALVGRDLQRHRERHAAARAQHPVVGTHDARADAIALAAQDRLLAAGVHGVALGVLARAEERERALAAAQVRDAHPREQEAAELHRREGDRNALDHAPDVLVAEQLPERLRLLEQLDARAPERHDVTADVGDALGRADVGGRQHRPVGAGVARQEVEDAVAAGVHSRREGRPRDGALRRIRGAEVLVAAFGDQRAEVRELPLLHQALEDHRVHAVHAQHEQAGARLRGTARSARQQGERQQHQSATLHAASFSRTTRAPGAAPD